mgnify:CR=1 FL=1
MRSHSGPADQAKAVRIITEETWKKKDGWDGMVHCSEKQYQHFVETQEMQQLLTSGESIRKEPLIQPFASGRNDIVFHMTDNGQYSGSIVFQDIDQDVLEKKEECKCLEEISAIIQNRLNLERHDLSAKRNRISWPVCLMRSVLL